MIPTPDGLPWILIQDTALKPMGQVLLAGPSGYIAPNEWHIESGHWDTEKKRWMTDGNDNITEGWPDPEYYMLLN